MQVAAQMGWSEDRLNWTCWDDYNAMLGHLAAGDGVCHVSPAGVGVTPSTLETGLVFSMPTLTWAPGDGRSCRGSGPPWQPFRLRPRPRLPAYRRTAAGLTRLDCRR
jgi:hypothetical protein